MTFETVNSLLQQSANRFGQSERIEIDLSDVNESDSAGLALMIEWKRLARQKSSEISFANTPRPLVALASISEVGELLGLTSAAAPESESVVAR